MGSRAAAAAERGELRVTDEGGVLVLLVLLLLVLVLLVLRVRSYCSDGGSRVWPLAEVDRSEAGKGPCRRGRRGGKAVLMVRKGSRGGSGS